MRAVRFELNDKLGRCGNEGFVERAVFDGGCLDCLELVNVSNPFSLDYSAEHHRIGKDLKHIAVNPNNSYVSKLIADSYVFSSPGAKAPYSIVNSDSASVRKFVALLVDAAKRERDLSFLPLGEETGEAQNESSVYILSGERGAGKTFFLNYALTLEDAFLDKMKTIWVRVNLVYRSEYSNDLVGWILAQCAKICLRYYDVNSGYGGKKSLDVAEHIRNWLKYNQEMTDTLKLNLERAFLQMRRAFCEIGHDRAIDPRICPDVICQEIYKYARENGWSFIFVIDGLDVLDIDVEQIKKFETYKSQVEGLISMSPNFGAVMLVVARNNTLANHLAVEPFRSISGDFRFSIGEPVFLNVLERRFSGLRAAIASRDIDTVNRKRLLDLLEQFRLKILHDEPFVDDPIALGQSLRARMHTLYLDFVDFAGSRTGQGYRLIEHMLLNGHRYPVVAYGYARDEEGSLRPHPTGEVRYEARFLPIITRVPAMYPGFDPRASRSAESNSILLGIRILQVLMAVEQNRQKIGQVTIMDVADLLGDLLGYSTNSIRAMIFELLSFEFVEIRFNASVGYDSMQNEVGLTTKAGHFFKHALFDVAYLNLAAMRTRLPAGATGKIVELAHLEARDRNLEKWVRVKVVNATFLFCLMMVTDAAEKRRARRDRGKLGRRSEELFDIVEDFGIWGIFRDRVPTFSADLGRIFASEVGLGPPFFGEEWREDVFDRVRSVFEFFGVAR